MLLAVALAACESPLSPDEAAALRGAEARWAARSFRDYAIEARQACFCPESVTQWARVEVVAGRVNRVILLATGVEVPAPERSYFPTVERVFSAIRTAAADDWVKDVVVAFDRALGFPTFASLVPEPNVIDAGTTYYIRNAEPLP